LPARSGPLTFGSSVFVTAVTAGGAGGGATVAVAALEADAEPPAFDAVTTTRSVRPTSELASAYCEPFAPLMSAQAPPPVSQRRHW
jgi:sugar (pentulose or hexulose) kinase